MDMSVVQNHLLVGRCGFSIFKARLRTCQLANRLFTFAHNVKYFMRINTYLAIRSRVILLILINWLGGILFELQLEAGSGELYLILINQTLVIFRSKR